STVTGAPQAAINSAKKIRRMGSDMIYDILYPANFGSQRLVLPEPPFHNRNTPAHTGRVYLQDRCEHLHLQVCIVPPEIGPNLTYAAPLPVLRRANHVLGLLSQFFANLFHKLVRLNR